MAESESPCQRWRIEPAAANSWSITRCGRRMERGSAKHVTFYRCAARRLVPGGEGGASTSADRSCDDDRYVDVAGCGPATERGSGSMGFQSRVDSTASFQG
jgi:hypothetical protein